LIGYILGIVTGHLFWSMDSLDWRTPDQKKIYCKEMCR